MKHKSLNKVNKHQDIKKTVDNLAHLLADSYVLYVKTQNYHWNVKSPQFPAYHKMFEEQYQELAEAVDVIAERIRALNSPTPATLSKFLQLTSLHEGGMNLSAEEMIHDLLKDHDAISKMLASFFEPTEEMGDQATLDLYVERKRAHDKTAWMLRSTLG